MSIQDSLPHAKKWAGGGVRSLEEIAADISDATSIGDAGALRALAQEMQTLGTASSEAASAKVLGWAGYLADDYPSALEYYRRAVALHGEQGDNVGVAAATGNIIASLLDLDRYDEAAQLLDQQATMQMDSPVLQSVYKGNCARLAEHHGHLDVALDHLMKALEIATRAGIRGNAASFRELLRDLAQKRNDFEVYIEHNTEYLRIAEEIRGRQAIEELAMMEAERKAEAVEREREKE